MMTETLTNKTADPYQGISELDIKRLQFPRWGHTIFAAFLLFVELFGLVENILVLVTFFRMRDLRSATNMFVIGLCIADLCMITVGCPWPMISAFSGRWVFNDDICTFAGFIVYFFGLTQLYLLTAVSVDRYIVISKPLKSAMITKRIAVLSCAGCFAGGLFWALLPLVGWSSYGLEPCGVFCGLDMENIYFSFVVTIFFTCFLLPFLTICYCYYNIYVTIRNVNRKLDTAWDMNSRRAQRNFKLEKKLLKSSLLMCGSFWVCWFPYVVVFFWQGSFGIDTLPLAVSEFSGLAAKSQGVLNPLIYCATNTVFRKAFYENLPFVGVREWLLKKESDKPGSDQPKEENDGKTSGTLAGGNGNPNAVAPTEEIITTTAF